MIQNRPRYSNIPEVVSGYGLDRYQLSIILPEASTNLITNPSVERDTTGYTASGSTVTRISTEQSHGVYGLQIVPDNNAGNEGVYFGTVALTATETYTFSCDVRGRAGVRYQIYITDTSGVQVSGTTTFKATGKWQRVNVRYTETATANRRFYLTTAVQNGGTFYTDGWQVENKPYPTTYIDGDQQGLVRTVAPAYQWNAAPHASTSTRSRNTRAGGRVVLLSEYGFTPMALVGLGMPTPNNIVDPLGIQDGSQYQRTLYPERGFSIAGTIQATNPTQFEILRSRLYDTMRRDSVDVDQPLVLRFEYVDDCGRSLSETLEIVCSYAGGLEATTNNFYQERVTIAFAHHDVTMQAMRDVGSELTISQTVVLQTVGKRVENVWSPAANNFIGSHEATAILRSASDGLIYMGGSFQNLNSDPDWDFLARINMAGNWEKVPYAAPPDLRVFTLVNGPDRRLYVGGGFGEIDNNTNISRIGVFDPTTDTWSAFGNGATGGTSVYSIAFDLLGNMYVGGGFTEMSFVANTNRIARWNVTSNTWEALDTGLNGDVWSIVVDQNGLLYAGGDFTLGGSDRIATFDTTNISTATWQPLSTGANARVQQLIFGQDGDLYVGGSFTTIGGVNANSIAAWNGVSFRALGTGLTDDSATVEIRTLQIDSDNTLYVTGTFRQVGDIQLNIPNTGTRTVARWRDSTWSLFDVLYGTNDVYGLLVEFNANVWLNVDNATILTAAPSTVINPGTADAYPIFTFVRDVSSPAGVFLQLVQISNATTGKELLLAARLLPGESAVLNLEPANISFTTSFGRSIPILGGSDIADFRIIPGENVISILYTGSSAAGDFATVSFRPRYTAIADATYQVRP